MRGLLLFLLCGVLHAQDPAALEARRSRIAALREQAAERLARIDTLQGALGEALRAEAQAPAATDAARERLARYQRALERAALLPALEGYGLPAFAREQLQGFEQDPPTAEPIAPALLWEGDGLFPALFRTRREELAPLVPGLPALPALRAAFAAAPEEALGREVREAWAQAERETRAAAEQDREAAGVQRALDPEQAILTDLYANEREVAGRYEPARLRFESARARFDSEVASDTLRRNRLPEIDREIASLEADIATYERWIDADPRFYWNNASECELVASWVEGDEEVVEFRYLPQKRAQLRISALVDEYNGHVDAINNSPREALRSAFAEEEAAYLPLEEAYNRAVTARMQQEGRVEELQAEQRGYRSSGAEHRALAASASGRATARGDELAALESALATHLQELAELEARLRELVEQDSP